MRHVDRASGKSAGRTRLDPTLKSATARAFEEQLLARVVGQEQAVHDLSSLYEVALARMNPPNRPIGTMLFLGPTGSGKTRVAEAAAEVLFGTGAALIKIDCAEYQHPHEIAKLIGSPPGYVGHGETTPLLTQEALERQDASGTKLAIVLFDEIEKASPAFWQLLLGVLDRAVLTLGNNRRVDFSRTIVIMSSNLGADEMSTMLAGGVGFGLVSASSEKHTVRLGEQLRRVAIEAARRNFSPEFMNRIDKTVVFRPLADRQLREVLDLELVAVQRRILSDGGSRIRFRCSDEVRALLLREGTDARYGARHLKRAIDRILVAPLARLITSGQALARDLIDVHVDVDSGELTFHRIADEADQAHANEQSSVARPDVAPTHVDDPRRLAAAVMVATTVAVTTAVSVAAGLAAGRVVKR